LSRWNSCSCNPSRSRERRSVFSKGQFPQFFEPRHIAASPGYFTSTFVNGIKLESTSTRRAGLIKFTFPTTNPINHVVVDLTNDLQRSFHGGSLDLASNGRIKLQGTFQQVRRSCPHVSRLTLGRAMGQITIRPSLATILSRRANHRPLLNTGRMHQPALHLRPILPSPPEKHRSAMPTPLGCPRFKQGHYYPSTPQQ